jgi:AcrR family transcriptional regulator
MQKNSAKPSRREGYSEATRRALLKAARRSFTAQGYAGASLDAIAGKAGVTKGALYHHFIDKRALFDAVVASLQAEMTEAVDAEVSGERDRWQRLKRGIAAFLDACGEIAYRRLVIHEAPAVLGMERFREIDDAALASFHRAIASLQQRGDIDFANATLLTRLLAALVWETAMLLSEAQEPRKLRAQALDAIYRVVDTFRKT